MSFPTADGLLQKIDDDYDRLPEAVKFSISRKEWLWLTAEQKAGLTQTETEPESWEC